MRKSRTIFILAFVIVLISALYACNPDGVMTIKFQSNGGSEVKNVTFEAGATEFKFPIAPTKTGYDFDDWHLDSALTQKANVANVLSRFVDGITEITLYAKWTPVASETITYTISFNSGEGGSAVANISIAEDATTFTMPAAPTKADNDFAGWYLESGLTTAATVENVLAALTPATKTITLFAKWTPAVTYNISYSTDGGSPVAPSIFPEGTESFVFPAAPTKTACVFLGWYLENTFTTAATVENVLAGLTKENNTRTLYAKWRDAITNTVNFDAGGGTIVRPVSFFETDMTFALPANIKREDDFFDGWFLDLEDEAAVTVQEVIALFNAEVTEITLYAKWTLAYYISFSGEFFDDIEPLIIRQDATAIELPNAKVDYTFIFDGWYFVNQSDEQIDANVTSIMAQLSSTTKTIELLAKTVPAWIIAFDNKPGFEIPALRLRSGATTFDLPAALTRPESTFEGWYFDDMPATAESVLAEFVPGQGKRVTLYAKWTRSAAGEEYDAAKEGLIDAILFAYDETRGRGVKEELSTEDIAELDRLEGVFGFSYDYYFLDEYQQEYENYSLMRSIQNCYYDYVRYMELFRKKGTKTPEEQQEMEGIWERITGLENKYIPSDLPNYYQRLKELREEGYLFADCGRYITLYDMVERDPAQQDEMDNLRINIEYSDAFQNLYFGDVHDFAVYFTTDEDMVFSAEEEPEARAYVKLLRKLIEHETYVENRRFFAFLTTDALAYLFSQDDIALDKITKITAELNKFDYTTMTKGSNEDDSIYYYPDPQGMLDGFLFLASDEASGWSSDDFGVLFHKYIRAVYSIIIEISPATAEKIQAERDTITVQFSMEFAEIVLGLMGIVDENGIIGNFSGEAESLEEIVAAISSVSEALKEFTATYDDEILENLISTILPLTSLEMVLPESICTFLAQMKHHAFLSKLGDVLAVVDLPMLESVLIFNTETNEAKPDAKGEFFYDNLAIIEAKMLCAIYGENYNAAEFAASYNATQDELFSGIAELLFAALFGSSREYDAAPENKASPFSYFLFEGDLKYVGGRVLKDIGEQEICISDARYNALKAISQKAYDTAVTPAERENLIVTKIDLKASEIAPELYGIYQTLDLFYDGQEADDVESKEIQLFALSYFLAQRDVDIEKIRNFKYMLEYCADDLEAGFDNGIIGYHLPYFIYSLFTAYDDDTEKIYTPFTIEDVSALLSELLQYATDYYIGEDETPELIAALQVFAANVAYTDDISFMVLKLAELYSFATFEETEAQSEIIYALEGLRDYYTDSEILVPEDAIVALYQLYRIIRIGDRADPITIANIDEFLSMFELVIGNEKYNSFDEVIELLISVFEEDATHEAVAVTDEDDTHAEYYSAHNFIKTLYLVFGATPATEFADVFALAGEGTSTAEFLKLVIDNYDAITTWAAIDYNYEANNIAFDTALGSVVDGMFTHLYWLFPKRY